MQHGGRPFPMPKQPTFSEQLRAAIDASKLSRQEICDAIGLHKSVLSRFLSGQSGLAVPTIDRLCAVLGLRLTTEKRGRSKP